MLSSAPTSSSWCRAKYRQSSSSERLNNHRTGRESLDKTQQIRDEDGSKTKPKCQDLSVNQNMIEYKMRCVADCLVHLCREHAPLDQFYCDQQSTNTFHRMTSGIDEIGFNACAAQQHQANRIKVILKTYSIILRLSPIEAHLKSVKYLTKSPNGPATFCPLDARQHVLNLIENRLPGYCDSIDLLRCILRSNHMIGAFAAFSVIVKKITAYNSDKLQKDLEALKLSNDGGTQGDFRIVQEWIV